MSSKKQILLGMSGGADSSVAAILLQEQGYQVKGVTFLFVEKENSNDIDDARATAQKLGIEHYVMDVRTVFNETIVEYFSREYLKGRTPFPCAKCNNELKWDLLIKEANRLKIEQVAMGHYANIEQKDGYYFITQGIDPDKDQSFFLWGLKQKQLARIVLPLGNYFKNEIRQIAAQKNLARVASKKDSLGACFVDGDYRPVLKAKLQREGVNIEKGNFVDEAGQILGQHEGYMFYTVGQRHGLVYLNKKVYVKEIRPASNEVVLATLDSLYKNSFEIFDTNFVDEQIFKQNTDIIVRIRYRKQSHHCKLTLLDHRRALISTDEPLEAIAPGQTAVLYQDKRVVGGGFIK